MHFCRLGYEALHNSGKIKDVKIPISFSYRFEPSFYLAPENQETNATITFKSCITEDANKCIINFNVCKYF